MARLFLDANAFIDVFENRDPRLWSSLENNSLYVSTSSIEIWAYVYKLKVPNTSLSEVMKAYNIVGVTQDIVAKSFEGPTTDFEDNVQLHSAAEVDCDIFLTKDSKLLKLGFFGKMRVINSV